MAKTRTAVEVGWRDWWRVNVRGALHYRMLRRQKDHPWRAGYDNFLRRKHRGALNDDQIRELTNFQVDTVTADFTTRTKGGLTLSQQRFLSEIEDLIRHQGLRSAVNIGARVDHYCAHLAHHFPTADFYSVDFQPNLEQHNSLLERRPNWHFRSGYPLRLIQDAAVRADLYFFVSTSVLMNDAELDLYLDAMAPHARALAFCEGWWPSAERLDFRIRRPETIPEGEPYCGGEYSNYHHNYVAKLKRRGYRIISSRIVPESSGYHYLQLFAVKS